MPTAFDNYQPSIGITEILCTQGIFPPRDGAGSGGQDYVGSIRHFAFNFVPGGAATNGQLLSISQNTALFSILGTTYGGNGTTNFALPNLHLTLALGAGSGLGLTDLPLGGAFGIGHPSLTLSNMPDIVGGTNVDVGNSEPSLGINYIINAFGTFEAGQLTDIGMVSEFAGNFAPAGTLICDGSLLNIGDYEALFTLIGTTYGGDGVTTFALPDLRGRTIVGANNLGSDVGTVTGSDHFTIGTDNLPPEVHFGTGAGLGTAIDNHAPSLTMTYMIAVQGVFPSRDAGGLPDSTPVMGEIIAFAGTQIPPGFLACNGQLLPINQNQALFALLGTTYGGDGRTTFALPNLGGIALVGAASDEVGHLYGSDTVQLTLDNIPGLFLNGDDNNQNGIDHYDLAGANDADHLFGYGGSDVLIGRGGNDWLDGGTGIDVMTGGLGDDTYIVDDLADVVNESAGQGVDSIRTDLAAYSLAGLANVENILGTGVLDQQLTGNDGNNRISGGAGADTMIGGLGNDTFVVDQAGDVVVEAAAGGTDTVESFISYILGTDLENLTLLGSAAINATGNEGNNVLVGNSAANRLNGLAGADTMRGGGGNDTYVVDNAGDTVREFSGGGTDLVLSSVSFALSAYVDNLTLTGLAAINATGNDLANVLVGNGAANILNGLGGADSMSGGAGDDTYIVDNAADSLREYSGAGTDLVQSSVSWSLGAYFENLTLSGSTAINGTGNGLENVLIGNSGANILNGGGGADIMRGGAGNDTYVVDNNGDSLREYAGAGTDLVQSSISWTLTAYLENLTLTGSAAINGTGNGLDNVLVGNSGANLLVAGQGADTLDGGLGNDTLNGGAGADMFRFSSALNGATNHDSIVGFNPADDTIQLDRAVFSAFAANGALSASEFHAGTSAQDADDRIIYDAATGHIYYDADGNGAGAQVLFAEVTPGVALTNADFLIVG